MGLKHDIINSHFFHTKTTNQIYCTVYIDIKRFLNMKKSFKNLKLKYKRWKVHKAHKLQKSAKNINSIFKQMSSSMESNHFLPEDQILLQELNTSIKIIIDETKCDKLLIESDTILSQLGNFADNIYLPNSIMKNNYQITSISHTNISTPTPIYTVINNRASVSPEQKNNDKNEYFKFEDKILSNTLNESEYDMDEEDYAWLDLISKQFSGTISARTFEFLIDRIEKKAFILQYQEKSYMKNIILNKEDMKFTNILPIKNMIVDNDEDAVCCICNDGECSNSNVILFCDACNIAVHQECYGVPYIPEGQWLCRVCLQESSTSPAHVNCVLCPNRGGAYKRVHDISNTNFKLSPEGLKDEMPEHILNPSAICLWSHVVCALWIPEVSFGNMVFLEPVDNVERIPAARWRLTCYICRQKNVGACIQCHKSNCYTAFHVTCAQQAGLYMVLETSNNHETKSSNTHQHSAPMSPMTIRKIAYCDIHLPPNLNKEDWAKSWSSKLFLDSFSSPKHSSHSHSSILKYCTPTATCLKRVSTLNNNLNLIKRARKVLAERRAKKPIPPIVVLPQIPVKSLTTLCRMEWPTSPTSYPLPPPAPAFLDKERFLRSLLGYWKLKRQARNGFPLIKRLQSQMHGPNLAATLKELIVCEQEREANLSPPPPPISPKRSSKIKSKGTLLQDHRGSNRAPNITALDRDGDLLKPWLKLRQDLEKARLLVELIQKREKMKKEQISLYQRLLEQRLVPLTTFLRRILTYLEGVDSDKIFSRPVNLKEVPDYLAFIKKPMDFATMRKKLETNEYNTFQDFVTDFKLILSNCKTYNPRDNFYYKTAVNLEEETKEIISEAANVLINTTNISNQAEGGDEIFTLVDPLVTKNQFKNSAEAKSNTQESEHPCFTLPSGRQKIHELEDEITAIQAQIREAKQHSSRGNRSSPSSTTSLSRTRHLRTLMLHKHQALHHEKKRIARLAPAPSSTDPTNPTAPKRQSSKNCKPIAIRCPPSSSFRHCEPPLPVNVELDGSNLVDITPSLLLPDKIVVTFPLCYYKNVEKSESPNSYLSNATPYVLSPSPCDQITRGLSLSCSQSNPPPSQHSLKFSSARSLFNKARSDSIESIATLEDVKLRVTVVNPSEESPVNFEQNRLEVGKSKVANKVIPHLNEISSMSHLLECNATKDESTLRESNLGGNCNELVQHCNGREVRLPIHDSIACPAPSLKNLSKPFKSLENGIEAKQQTSFAPRYNTKLFGGMVHSLLEPFTLNPNKILENDNKQGGLETPLNKESFKVYRNEDTDQALYPDNEEKTQQNGDNNYGARLHEDMSELSNSSSSSNSSGNQNLGADGEGDAAGDLALASGLKQRARDGNSHSSPHQILCVKSNGHIHN